ncbi:MAG: RsbS, negative regulator of sigma-B [uncultured Corynebacteriales bacterium]|uniref:RsbS, negative regulator of sigma-B n=1 Tax=uncultured Mycobacteriales bacterium TaxID=581187 RepID=A0A6J4JX31_9ACTN|nr:MAG: RsbS, negative regulator of sigma-B [uncultured Corynebacteriales bacterium]
MTFAEPDPPQEPLRVSILSQGSYLIASIHTALNDSQLTRFQRDLIDRIGRDRARGVVIDVAALDVLDSFGSRTLRDIARAGRLRGAVTVIVGIAPDLALSMVRLGLDLDLPTALDLEEGLAHLAAATGAGVVGGAAAAGTVPR